MPPKQVNARRSRPGGVMMSILHVAGRDSDSRDSRQASLSNDYINADKDKITERAREPFAPKKSGEIRRKWVKQRAETEEQTKKTDERMGHRCSCEVI